jgi:hypothetical protein
MSLVLCTGVILYSLVLHNILLFLSPVDPSYSRKLSADPVQSRSSNCRVCRVLALLRAVCALDFGADGLSHDWTINGTEILSKLKVKTEAVEERSKRGSSRSTARFAWRVRRGFTELDNHDRVDYSSTHLCSACLIKSPLSIHYLRSLRRC